MLRWLANRRWNKRRLIFRFNNGCRKCSADPLLVAMSLHAHPDYLPRHLYDAADGDREAVETVAQAACDVFGVAPLAPDGKSGLTITERVELMQAFDLYMDALKKNTGHSLTSSPSTAETSPASDETTTKPTSDSGPTEPAQPSESPTPTESESSPVKTS